MQGLSQTAERVGLLRQVRACQACQDLPLGPRPLLQVHPEARILVAGQAPGRLTHAKGRPFDDPSGVRLRRWLGVDEACFYDECHFAFLPMGFCFPGTGKGGDLPPRPECAPLWRRSLLDCLPNLGLTLLIGRYAIDWHLPALKGQTISQAASAWQDYWPSHLVMPHPSPRNNRWLRQNPWFEDEVVPKLQTAVRSLLD